jgi:hypothetical protein
LLGHQNERRRAYVAAARDVHAHARRAHHARKVVAIFGGGVHAVVALAHTGLDEAAFGDARGHGRLQVLDIGTATAGFDIGHAVVGGIEQPVHVADMSGSGRCAEFRCLLRVGFGGFVINCLVGAGRIEFRVVGFGFGVERPPRWR